MFQHPALTAQFATDRRFARRADATRRSIRHATANRRALADVVIDAHIAPSQETLMFQHPSFATQRAADHRAARSSEAVSHRAWRAATTSDSYEPDVGERVAAVGIDRVAADVAAVVRVARSRGVGTSLASIVADRTAPPVARERALGRLLAVLAADRERGTTGSASEPAA